VLAVAEKVHTGSCRRLWRIAVFYPRINTQPDRKTSFCGSSAQLDFLCLNTNSLMQFPRPVRLQFAFRDDMGSDKYWLAAAEPNRSSIPGTRHLDGESASQKDRA
jgi:hypothetical protein